MAMDVNELAKIFKALSHPKRLELFFKIAESQETNFEAGCECLVTSMINALKIGAPTVSHHLKELENAGLIVTERQGKYLLARVRADTVTETARLFIERGGQA